MRLLVRFVTAICVLLGSLSYGAFGRGMATGCERFAFFGSGFDPSFEQIVSITVNPIALQMLDRQSRLKGGAAHFRLLSVAQKRLSLS